MKKHGIFMRNAVICILAAVAVLASGCSRDKGGPYRIGAIMQSTSETDNEYKALMDTVAAINAEGGVRGQPIEVVVEQAGGDEVTNLMSAKKLIETDLALMVLMAETEGVSNSVAVVFSQSKTPMLFYGRAAPDPKEMTDWNIIKPRFSIESLTPLTPEQQWQESETNMKESLDIIKTALVKGGRDKGRIRKQLEAGVKKIQH